MKKIVLSVGLILSVSSVAQATDLSKLPDVLRRMVEDSEPGNHDNPSDLVDVMKWTRLEEIEAAKATSSKLDLQPWSDSYWPMYAGGLARRYADPFFPDTADWKQNTDYVTANLQNAAMTVRSPAEKYDLLVGDAGFSMTRQGIEAGRPYFERDGEVETWMGICHGWAPASYMVDRPLHSVTVESPTGEPITFLPADIRGLATLLWANGNARMRFVGGRCNDRDPSENSSGRPTAEECIDNNPATWHLTIVNQIGAAHRSFIMDAVWNYQVWNHPILGYEYKVFNVKTGQAAEKAGDARVPVSDYAEDPYLRHRSPKARFIVGIRMSVNYMTENSPTTSITGSLEDDHLNRMEYEYDLELDEQGTIVGGEWHAKHHPDFLWTPAPGATPTTRGDQLLDASTDSSRWTDARVPATWGRPALLSSKRGTPLARIVTELVRRSRL